MDSFLYYVAGRFDCLQRIVLCLSFVYTTIYALGVLSIALILFMDDFDDYKAKVKVKKLLWVGTILFILLSVLAVIFPNSQELTNLIHEMYGG